MGLRGWLARLVGGGRAASPGALSGHYGGIDFPDVWAILARHPDLVVGLLRARPALERAFPGGNPWFHAMPGMPSGKWELILHLATDRSKRDFDAAWAAFDRDWWTGRLGKGYSPVRYRPQVTFCTPPHDARDMVDRFFHFRATAVAGFLDAHPRAVEVLAPGLAALGALGHTPPSAPGLTSYYLDLERGGDHPRLVCSLATPVPLGLDARQAALDRAWAPLAAAAPDLLAPKARVSPYVV